MWTSRVRGAVVVSVFCLLTWPGMSAFVVTLTGRSAHVDPSTFSLERLAAVRGAMWTARLNVPFGPRPNRDDNILALAFYDLYDAPTRQRMLEAYKARGYTHSVTGPITGNTCYHNLYPCRRGHPSQEHWDAYLDRLQEQWDAGVIPIYFAHPDGWTLPANSADMDVLDALHRQPRAQQLLRVVVYAGWEPSGTKHGWNNDQYIAWAKRGADVFPNAVRFLHTVSDLDAPTGQNDSAVFPAGQANAIAWQRIAPYIHGWFDQLGGYVGGRSEVPSQAFKDEFAKHVNRVRRGFREGYGGWPRSSAWGDRPLLYIAAEYAAYGNFWSNWREQYALDLGDLAMQAGADGYLDGGRVPVPSK
jgi:hypothetical protein